MLTRRATLLALLGMPLIGCATGSGVQLPPGTTLIMVRHADRTGEDLNERGLERARALVTALDGVQIDRIYSPGIKRNLDTATPLAEDRGLPITRIPPVNAAPRILSESAGQTAIWIGNKGNLTEIWEAIGAPGEPPLNYGDLFIVTPRRIGSPAVERRRFGPETDD